MIELGWLGNGEVQLGLSEYNSDTKKRFAECETWVLSDGEI
jgi:hypothetical protein